MRVARVALFVPLALGQRKLKLWTIPTPTFFFAATDFIDDPRLQHGEFSAYAYGLQHRGLAVKTHAQVGLELCSYRCLSALPSLVAHRFCHGRSRQGVTDLSWYGRKPTQSLPRLSRQGWVSVALGHHDLAFGCSGPAHVAKSLHLINRPISSPGLGSKANLWLRFSE